MRELAALRPEKLELTVDLKECLLRLRIARQRVGALKLASVAVLVALIKVAYYVFSLMPLTTLDQGKLVESLFLCKSGWSIEKATVFC